MLNAMSAITVSCRIKASQGDHRVTILMRRKNCSPYEILIESSITSVHLLLFLFSSYFFSSNDTGLDLETGAPRSRLSPDRFFI